jgi:adenylate cyclase
MSTDQGSRDANTAVPAMNDPADVESVVSGLTPLDHEPKTLHELAVSVGIGADDIERATADGTLGLLIVDHLVVPEPGVYTQSEMEARSGLGLEARRFWRALGFPDPDPDDRVFSQMDLEMLQLVDAMLRLDLVDRETALQIARVIGSSMERVAQSQIDSIEARVDGDGAFDEEELAVQRTSMLLPTIPRVLEYAWRRHLQSAARRSLVRDTMAAGGQQVVTVGFADLVGFTALSQQLDDHELAEVVDRFEATAYDLVAERGGRVVKMIGDEVMFEVADVVVGVDLALDLADAYHHDDSVSDVRVGIACGPVLRREGDLYGPTVNLASRVVGIAYAGSVVASGDVREALEGDERFAWKSLRTRYLKGLGRVQLHAVRRADDVAEGFAERARRRRGQMVDRVTDLVERRLTSSADEPADEDG